MTDTTKTGCEDSLASSENVEKSYLDFYRAVEISLKTISNEIINHDSDTSSYTPDSYDGRGGSTRFEKEFLKPAIKRNQEYFVESVNEQLETDGNRFSFVEIVCDEDTDEASSRTMEDVSITLKEKGTGNKIWVPVNVKATKKSNGTSDNIGGWSALNYAMFGEAQQRVTQRTAMKNLEEKEIQETLSDYFLWVFYKDLTDKNSVLSNCKVFSFFGSSLDGFKVNMAQPFPLQFNCSQCSHEIENTQESYLTRKINFLSHFLSKRESTQKANLEQTQKVLQKYNLRY